MFGIQDCASDWACGDLQRSRYSRVGVRELKLSYDTKEASVFSIDLYYGNLFQVPSQQPTTTGLGCCCKAGRRSLQP